MQSVEEADLPRLVAVFDHVQLDDPTRHYGDAFCRTALDFRIPVAQWDRGEVGHLVHFLNRAHALAEDMMHALDDPCFCLKEQGTPLPPEPLEGMDETHTLPSLDGVYKAIHASYFLTQMVELVVRSGFSGDFLEARVVEQLQAWMKHAARILAVPRGHWVLFDEDEFGSQPGV